MVSKATMDLESLQRLAALARLTLDAAEAPRLLADMRSILAYVDKLSELDTGGIAPTTHAVTLPTKLRDDTVQPGLPGDAALKNAPEPLGSGFGVPKIIE